MISLKENSIFSKITAYCNTYWQFFKKSYKYAEKVGDIIQHPFIKKKS